MWLRNKLTLYRVFLIELVGSAERPTFGVPRLVEPVAKLEPVTTASDNSASTGYVKIYSRLETRPFGSVAAAPDMIVERRLRPAG